MERRTFLLALFGGVVAASIVPSLAEAATPVQTTTPPDVLPEELEISSDDKTALDEADKEFSQYYYRRRVYRRRVYYRRPIRRVYYRRPVRRVYYRRPVRRVYYRRPVRVLRFY
ncbi:MAG: hypothetical protein ACRCUE_08950 [Bosea sp. (in: a-proteobacteria)]